MTNKEIISIINDLQNTVIKNCDEICYECDFTCSNGTCCLDEKITKLKECIDKEENNERCE